MKSLYCNISLLRKRLDETTAELKKTSQALEVEKCKTETLLHQMLPRKVANALTHGQKVEAGTHTVQLLIFLVIGLEAFYTKESVRMDFIYASPKMILSDVFASIFPTFVYCFLFVVFFSPISFVFKTFTR